MRWGTIEIEPPKSFPPNSIVRACAYDGWTGVRMFAYACKTKWCEISVNQTNVRVVRNAANQYPICTPLGIYGKHCVYADMCVCEFVRVHICTVWHRFDHICCQFNKTNKLIEYWIGSSCRHICTSTHTHPNKHTIPSQAHTLRILNIVKKSIAPFLASKLPSFRACECEPNRNLLIFQVNSLPIAPINCMEFFPLEFRFWHFSLFGFLFTGIRLRTIAQFKFIIKCLGIFAVCARLFSVSILCCNGRPPKKSNSKNGHHWGINIFIHLKSLIIVHLKWWIYLWFFVSPRLLKCASQWSTHPISVFYFLF